MVDPLGSVSGVGSGPLGWYEASGSAQRLGFDVDALEVGCGVGGSDGSGVGL
ncbi:MAG TPA: hypothetical protein VFH20_05045 [Propionibacteriaceae bacterium]|nr:hypothetical protein [Propionibacteriaceae bacterium]